MSDQPTVDPRAIARPALAVVAAFSVAASTALGCQFQERDSLGVVIVETGGQRARALSGVTVRSEHALQIDESNGAYRPDIEGVALLREERVIVLDQAASELRFYDLQGQFLGRRGGHGVGRGEFESPRWLNTIAGDSVVIYDGGNERFTVYSLDGDGYRSFSGLVGGGAVRHASGGTRLLMVRGRGLPARDGDGPVVTARDVRLADVAGEASTMIATAPHRSVRIPNPTEGGPSSLRTAPYTYSPAAAVDRDGFLLASPQEPSILEYSWAGELRRIIRLLEPWNEVTDIEFRAAIEQHVDRLAGDADPVVRQGIRRAYDDLEPPEFEPPFLSLIVDEAGWLWAQAYQVNQNDATTWLLFDPDGVGRGSVLMPDGLTVSSISDDYVAGVWRDESEVEYVRLHRIDGLER